MAGYVWPCMEALSLLTNVKLDIGTVIENIVINNNDIDLGWTWTWWSQGLTECGLDLTWGHRSEETNDWYECLFVNKTRIGLKMASNEWLDVKLIIAKACKVANINDSLSLSLSPSLTLLNLSYYHCLYQLIIKHFCNGENTKLGKLYELKHNLDISFQIPLLTSNWHHFNELIFS